MRRIHVPADAGHHSDIELNLGSRPLPERQRGAFQLSSGSDHALSWSSKDWKRHRLRKFGGDDELVASIRIAGLAIVAPPMGISAI